jgi:predicted PurR-regulated permease PerM
MSMSNERDRSERLRHMIVTAVLALILYLLYLVLEPFFACAAWAVILAVTLWPLYERLRARLHDRPRLAASLVSLAVLVATFVPAVFLVRILAREISDLSGLFDSLMHGEKGDVLVASTRRIPLLGDAAAAAIERVRADPRLMSVYVQENRDFLVRSAGRIAGSIGLLIFNLLLAFLMIYFFLVYGETLGQQLRRATRRLGGERMLPVLRQVRETVKGVVYGSVLTAIVQAALAAIGFLVSGVPFPWLLGGAAMIASFLPGGTAIVWAPAGAWLLASGNYGWGIALLAWGGGVVSTVDNLVRPFFIGQAAKMPFLLVFLGVLGGVAAIGVLGLVVGPVVLAVALALWREWIGSETAAFTIQGVVTSEDPNIAEGDPAPKK